MWSPYKRRCGRERGMYLQIQRSLYLLEMFTNYSSQASFRPYSPFRFSWDKGKGRADTTQHRNETYLKSLSPYIGMSAVSDTFQDTTNKTTNLQLSPMTEKASTENVECPIKQEDEPYIADLTSAEEPVSPSPVGRLAAQ